jgi:hypothetical protein
MRRLRAYSKSQRPNEFNIKIMDGTVNLVQHLTFSVGVTGVQTSTSLAYNFALAYAQKDLNDLIMGMERVKNYGIVLEFNQQELRECLQRLYMSRVEACNLILENRNKCFGASVVFYICAAIWLSGYGQ